MRPLRPECAEQVVADASESIGWAETPARADVLRRAADLYEEHAGEFFALAAREAGKNALDAVSELREAVDFLRFYANEAERVGPVPRGVVVAISPWNFPLAIFTGQVAAALAAGNAVVAKPAVQTPLIAARATELLHEAGVPKAALQLCPGDGKVGAALVAVPGIAAVAFTGSTGTAKAIDRQLAETAPEAILVAETGGLNAMIVDSTALPEQAVRDIIASAFQSAGQRCSALRILYVQKDVAERILTMLSGAMEALVTRQSLADQLRRRPRHRRDGEEEDRRPHRGCPQGRAHPRPVRARRWPLRAAHRHQGERDRGDGGGDLRPRPPFRDVRAATRSAR